MANKTKIDEYYSVSADSGNFILHYERTYFDETKQKDVLSSREFYCVDIKHVMKVYQRECLRNNFDQLENINYIIEIVNRSEKTIIDFIKENYNDLRLSKK